MMAPRKIAVTGSTGRVGRHVVDALEARGHDVVPISRTAGVDVITGESLDDALVGVDAIVDTATDPSPEEEAATAFFTTAARYLQDAGARAGVERIVVVSIIGTDRFTGGYGAAKLAHEETSLAGPVPACVLRAAQFHEFVSQMVDWGRDGDVSYVPKMRTQLVAARAVAEKLADLATETGPGRESEIPEIAGPQVETLAGAARLLSARRRDGLRVEEVSDPDDPNGRLYESGALLPGPGATLVGPTFEQWLAREYP